MDIRLTKTLLASFYRFFERKRVRDDRAYQIGVVCDDVYYYLLVPVPTKDPCLCRTRANQRVLEKHIVSFFQRGGCHICS